MTTWQYIYAPLYANWMPKKFAYMCRSSGIDKMSCRCAKLPAGVQNVLPVCKMTCQCAKCSAGVQNDLPVFKMSCWCAKWPAGVRNVLPVCQITCMGAKYPVVVQIDLPLGKMTCRCAKMTYVNQLFRLTSCTTAIQCVLFACLPRIFKINNVSNFIIRM